MPTNRQFSPTKFRAIVLIGFLVALIIVGWVMKLYPIAIVNGDFVPYNGWVQDWSIAQKLDPTAAKADVFNQFITNKKKEQLVIKFGLGTNDAFSKEWDYYKTGNETQYNDLVSKYFSGDENLFESYVIEPETFDAMLQIKYNSNFAANNNEYNKAENILTKLSQSQSFDDLAKQYSDDKVSGQLGGDLGFVSEDQILPELKQAVENATPGEVVKDVVVSRLGYHILLVVESATKNNQKLYHLKQILIQTQGYDNWLNQQLNTIGAHQLMKI